MKGYYSLISQLLFLVFFFSFVFTQNYAWPTASSKILTSSFAEPRANRFHSGVDISTWNREGYECFAIADGYIFRIWVQPYGYGKALYIKLADGNIAVYAHLQRFEEKINDYVKQVQRKKGRYNINLFLGKKKFPVKKGDVVAYTGSTGIGTPHFHFEIREEMNTNVNTLSFYPNFFDKTPPTPLVLYGLALDTLSSVNREPIFSKISFEKKNDTTYTLLKPIEVTGKVGLAIEAIDRTLRKSAPTRTDYVSLWLDTTQIFYNHFSKTRYSENHFLNLDYLLFFKEGFNKKVKRLFFNEANKLREFYSFKNNGILMNPFQRDTILPVKIILKDAKKNATYINGFVRFQKVSLLKENHPYFLRPYLKDFPISLSNGFLLNDSLSYVHRYMAQKKIHYKDKVAKILLWKPEKKNSYKTKEFTFFVEKNTLIKPIYVFSVSLDKSYFPSLVSYQSDIVLLNPIDAFFDGYLYAKLNRKLKKREAIYEWHASSQRWRFLKSVSEYGEVRMRSMDVLTVLEDKKKPTIRFVDKRYRKGKKYFVLQVKDDLSGIRDERNYKIRYNQGILSPPEYDYETHRLLFDMEELRHGGILHIRLKDNVGNVEEAELIL